jgi:hypothetical protein
MVLLGELQRQTHYSIPAWRKRGLGWMNGASRA